MSLSWGTGSARKSLRPTPERAFSQSSTGTPTSCAVSARRAWPCLGPLPEEGSASSDIDLLVELQPKTFDSYMDVKLFLERVLGSKVDLVLADALKPRLRSAILADAVHATRLPSHQRAAHARISG